jgi:hypothetical protein
MDLDQQDKEDLNFLDIEETLSSHKDKKLIRDFRVFEIEKNQFDIVFCLNQSTENLRFNFKIGNLQCP